MIRVFINEAQFEYDIHSLVKAFYPAEDVKVSTEGRKEDAELSVLFEEKSIKVVIMKQGSAAERETRAVCFDGKTVDPETERAEKKNGLKRLLYEMLSDVTQKELPWGTLTGIRPTKLPMAMLEKGMTKQDILAYMQKTYMISGEKGTLCIEIAEKERSLLAGLHCAEHGEDGYSLYIGIPFCPTTCLYCSFTSYPIGIWKGRVEEYLTALEKEMRETAELFHGKILDTVYIGGGTPTTLQPQELNRLLSAAEQYFDLSQLQEFTVEAGRADSITAEKLRVLKAHGITRISVNPQTMKQETLDIIGRHHTVEQVKEAFDLARAEGFDNINMDVILGLPGENEEDVAHTMNEIKVLSPDSLTVHSLAVKRASGLGRWIEEHGTGMLCNTDETMKLALQAAADMGMEPYYLYRQKNMSGNFENVGYARPGKAGIYNILIMEEKQTIAALGPGSISKAVFPQNRIERCDNVKDAALYIERIDEMIERKRKLFGAVSNKTFYETRLS